MNKVLVLKTVDQNMKAYGGFTWPKSGPVSYPDWNPESVCGQGLHGLLWGEGNVSLLGPEEYNWLVLEVDSEKIIDLDGKVKFPECEVICCGSRDEAISIILEKNPGAACVFSRKMVGNGGEVHVGDYGTATAGNRGKATAGDGGKAIAGNRGKATAGDDGNATAGDSGTATAGYRGTATVGNFGQATAGECGRIEIEYWDGKRYRRLIGYVGEEVEANVMYKIIDGKFVKVL